MTKVLSIVIPAYNEERFIGTLLEQIRAVDLEPIGVSKQVIVVDDHSSDRTSEIVGRLSRGEARAAAEERRQGAGGPERNGPRDRRLPDHPGRGSRVRPARLPSDDACAYSKGAAT